MLSCRVAIVHNTHFPALPTHRRADPATPPRLPTCRTRVPTPISFGLSLPTRSRFGFKALGTDLMCLSLTSFVLGRACLSALTLPKPLPPPPFFPSQTSLCFLSPCPWQALALANLVDIMGWPTVATLSTTDSYGESGVSAFINAAAELDVFVATKQTVQTGQVPRARGRVEVRCQDDPTWLVGRAPNPPFFICNSIDHLPRLAFHLPLTRRRT